jgi:flagellar basal body rod protein FlgG
LRETDPRTGEFLGTYSAPDTRPGVLQRTGSSTDLALEGSGYLAVQSPRGLELFRGGPVRVDATGRLATHTGALLLSAEGRPIVVGDKPWEVAADGTVTAGGAVAGRLRVVRPEGPLRREGATLLSAGSVQDVADASVRVLQGYVERSNVDPVREMVDMVAGVRAYESAQRAVLAQDQTLQSLFELLRTR